MRPAKMFVDTIGAIVVLTSKTLVSAVRGPYPYGEEFVHQFLFALRMCVVADDRLVVRASPTARRASRRPAS